MKGLEQKHDFIIIYFVAVSCLRGRVNTTNPRGFRHPAFTRIVIFISKMSSKFDNNDNEKTQKKTDLRPEPEQF